MKTFNLSVVQDNIRRELQASSSLLETIEVLQQLRAHFEEGSDEQREIDALLSKLSRVSEELVEGASSTSQHLQSFIRMY